MVINWGDEQRNREARTGISTSRKGKMMDEMSELLITQEDIDLLKTGASVQRSVEASSGAQITIVTRREKMNDHQPTLWTIEKPKKSIRERFVTFHNGNPNVYRRLCELARDVQAAGHKNAAIGLLWERLRWENYMPVKTSVEKYKLNDHFRAEYARLIMNREPDLQGFFETRALRRQE